MKPSEIVEGWYSNCEGTGHQIGWDKEVLEKIIFLFRAIENSRFVGDEPKNVDERGEKNGRT